jgi:hypothetical protein
MINTGFEDFAMLITQSITCLPLASYWLFAWLTVLPEPSVNLYVITWHYMPEGNNLWVPQRQVIWVTINSQKTVFYGWLMGSYFEKLILTCFLYLLFHIPICFCHYCFQYFITTVHWTKHQFLFIVDADSWQCFHWLITTAKFKWIPPCRQAFLV